MNEDETPLRRSFALQVKCTGVPERLVASAITLDGRFSVGSVRSILTVSCTRRRLISLEVGGSEGDGMLPLGDQRRKRCDTPANGHCRPAVDGVSDFVHAASAGLVGCDQRDHDPLVVPAAGIWEWRWVGGDGWRRCVKHRAWCIAHQDHIVLSGSVAAVGRTSRFADDVKIGAVSGNSVETIVRCAAIERRGQFGAGVGIDLEHHAVGAADSGARRPTHGKHAAPHSDDTSEPVQASAAECLAPEQVAGFVVNFSIR